MRKGYDITRVDFHSICELTNDLNDIRETYIDKGYELPLNSLLLVRKMYEKQFAKEDRIASGLTQKVYDMLDDRHRGTFISDGVADRFEALIILTQMKLLRTCMSSFEKGQPVTFGFNGTMPNDDTKDLLNLSLSSGEHLNISRTDALRYPESLYGTIPQHAEYEIYPEGESICLKGVTNPETNQLEDNQIVGPPFYDHSILFDKNPIQ